MSSTEFHRLEPGDLEDSFFERIIDAAPDGILLADSNRILRYLNPAATRILGGKQEELTGEPLPFEIECGKPSLFEKEASGTTSWYELRAEETRWQGEGVLLITMRDVTIYKTYENELQEQNRRLELLVEDVHRVDLALNTQQSGALGEMVVGIAHDLNNWLTPIVGFSEMLLVNTEADKEKMDLFLKNINSSAKEAAQAVQRLTRYSQLSREKGTDTLIDLNQVIEQCILLTKPRW
jgi:signal transduction histidine kinase